MLMAMDAAVVFSSIACVCAIVTDYLQLSPDLGVVAPFNRTGLQIVGEHYAAFQ